MRLVYLCAVDPPPPNSDFLNVQKFFESLPKYLLPRTDREDSPHMLYFADRVGSNWLPEFHDFAVVFLSDTLLTDKTALSCLSRAATAFPNMIGIDLYDNLSPEMQVVAKKYCKRIFLSATGKEFLITTFPEIAASFDLEEKKLNESLQNEGFSYLSEKVGRLSDQQRKNEMKSMVSFALSLAILFVILAVFFCNFEKVSNIGDDLDWEEIVVISAGIISLTAIGISMCRFFFLLGKSFMVESIRCGDRAHAIELGIFYLKLYKGKFKWGELRDVLQSWNIDKGSAFINLDAKDIEGLNFDKISQIWKSDKIMKI